MQTSLERIAKKAQCKSKHRFQNLYRMLNEKFLMESLSKLNKRAASGVDRTSYHDYAKNAVENVFNLVTRLKTKQYKAKLVKRKYIPKANGKMRPLGIPAIEDKLVQYAAKEILEAIYEQDFLSCSYGYRPQRGAKQAVRDLRRNLSENNYSFIVEADIKGFFDTIDHKLMIRMLEQRIDDKSFIQLIRKWLKAGILEKDKVLHPLTGTPQGGIISPILANIYMHYSLTLWFEKVVKKHCNGLTAMFVYADDFVCIFESKYDAERFYRVLGKRLGKFGLQLAPEKTNLINFSKWCGKKFDFLGFEYRLARTKRRYVQLRTSRKKLQSSMLKLKEWCKENRHKRLQVLFKELNNKLRGYYNYFAEKGNMKSVFRFYNHARGLLYKWLNRRGQRNSYNWEGFKMLVQHFGLLRPYTPKV